MLGSRMGILVALEYGCDCASVNILFKNRKHTTMFSVTLLIVELLVREDQLKYASSERT